MTHAMESMILLESLGCTPDSVVSSNRDRYEQTPNQQFRFQSAKGESLPALAGLPITAGIVPGVAQATPGFSLP